MKIVNRHTILAAALAIATMAASSSCKDDEEEGTVTHNFQPMKQLEPQTIEHENIPKDLKTATEYGVATLLDHWCGIAYDDIPDDFMSMTFDATFAQLADPDHPTEITLSQGNIEAADQFAISSFCNFGINANAPDGFQYDQDGVRLQYKHVDDDVTLAVITAQVPQIPDITKITFVKQEAAEHLDLPTYYHCGDVESHNGVDYICVTNHKHGEMSRWITFAGNHTYSSFEWLATGNDFIYNDTMASPLTIAAWLQNIYFNPEMLEEAQNANSPDIIPDEESIEPFTQMLLSQPYMINIFDAPDSPLFRALDDQDIWTVEDNKEGYTIRTYATRGLFLTNQPKWMLTDDYKNHYWVPYIALVPSDEVEEFESIVSVLPSQNSVQPRIFHWSKIAADIEGVSPVDGETFTYNIYLVAAYWRHQIHNSDGVFSLLNFTKDWSKKYGSAFIDTDWTRRNIRTKEIVFEDNGKPNEIFEK